MHGSYFPERRFRLVTELESIGVAPSQLCSAVTPPLGKVVPTIEHVKAVFDCCIRFYPHMKGIHIMLFRRANGYSFPYDKPITPFVVLLYLGNSIVLPHH